MQITAAGVCARTDSAQECSQVETWQLVPTDSLRARGSETGGQCVHSVSSLLLMVQQCFDMINSKYAAAKVTLMTYFI